MHPNCYLVIKAGVEVEGGSHIERWHRGVVRRTGSEDRHLSVDLCSLAK